MRAVEARGIGLSYGPRAALRDVDLDIEVGERVAVLGPNGSGKTTLLRILATAARPSTGTAAIFGLDIRAQRDVVRSRIGYLGHAPGLYAPLTALENLAFFCDLRGLSRRTAEDALDRVGLGAAAGRRVSELSRGMQQRLALARTVLHSPELLLLDEPDAGLDESGRSLLEHVAAGRTLLLATHDASLAATICSRSLKLDAGRLAVPVGASAGEP